MASASSANTTSPLRRSATSAFQQVSSAADRGGGGLSPNTIKRMNLGDPLPLPPIWGQPPLSDDVPSSASAPYTPWHGTWTPAATTPERSRQINVVGTYHQTPPAPVAGASGYNGASGPPVAPAGGVDDLNNFLDDLMRMDTSSLKTTATEVGSFLLTDMLSETPGDVRMRCVSASSSAASSRTGSPTSSTLPPDHHGESRLKICFHDYGVIDPTQKIQYVRFRGRKDAIIPNGVRGSTEIYHEPWTFEMNYSQPQSYSRPVIEWSITNMNSGTKTTRLETEIEAINREVHAKTICNKVLKMALDSRASELEMELAQLSPKTQPTKVMNLEGKIRALKPNRLLVGPLFFGLQHRTLQEKAQEQMLAKASGSGMMMAMMGNGLSLFDDDVL